MVTTAETAETFDPITRLSRDLREASKTMTADEARFLVDYYYIMQKDRIRSANQIRSMGDVEPHEVLQWLGGNTATLERNIKSSLELYASYKVPGQWAMSIHGIGPVISAGLLAHIDIEKTPSVSALWSFAGMNPEAVWAKGKKRPWNAKLRVICWHAGECFKRTSGSPKSFYGKFYLERKALEVERNDAGQFEDIARDTLKTKKIDKTTDTYKWYAKGKLPPGRLDLRATRYARKLFLSHYWQVLYQVHYEKEPPEPWILSQSGHVHLVPIPNWPMKAEEPVKTVASVRADESVETDTAVRAEVEVEPDPPVRAEERVKKIIANVRAERTVEDRKESATSTWRQAATKPWSQDARCKYVVSAGDGKVKFGCNEEREANSPFCKKHTPV